MDFIFYFLIFFFGASLGSFLNVLVERLPREEEVILSFSHCPNCKHRLYFPDLIPVFSFLILRGKCRYCGRKIARQYFLMEIVTGFLFLFVFWNEFGSNFERFLTVSPITWINILYLLFIISILVVIFAVDLKHGLILDKIVIPASIVVLVYNFFLTTYKGLIFYQNLKNDTGGLGPYLLKTDYFSNNILLMAQPFLLSVLGAFIISLLFLTLIIITRGRGMGGGDVKFGFLVGLISGWPGLIVAIFLAYLTGAIISLTLILTGKKKFGQTVPFGPFLVLGTFIALFWGEKLISWYLGLSG